MARSRPLSCTRGSHRTIAHWTFEGIKVGRAPRPSRRLSRARSQQQYEFYNKSNENNSLGIAPHSSPQTSCVVAACRPPIPRFGLSVFFLSFSRQTGSIDTCAVGHCLHPASPWAAAGLQFQTELHSTRQTDGSVFSAARCLRRRAACTRWRSPAGLILPPMSS